MGGTRGGILGMDADIQTGNSGAGIIDVLAAGDPPGTLGIDNAIPLDDVPRTVTRVTKDWEPPQPRSTPIVVGGTTLEQAARALSARAEWGEGGGALRSDRIPPGNSPNLTVVLHANLVHRLPQWTGYARASKTDQADWDEMIRHLKAHEDRHLEIAIEEANNLARDLMGKSVDDIVSTINEANDRMEARQKELDDDTDHGAKEDVPYGDVILHYTIK